MITDDNNMAGLIGISQQQVSSSDLPSSMGNMRSSATVTSSRQQQPHHLQQHQQQQHQHQGESHQIQILNMGPPTVMMDPSHFLSFPVLPNDAEVLLSLADSSEKHSGMS